MTPPRLVSRLQPYASTIFAEMSALAARVGAVNLGQGFPDEDGPAPMLAVAQQAIADGVNQYPPGPGIPQLRQAIAAQRKRHYGIDYDPDTEVLVTVGGTEAIAAAVIGLVEPDSEVLIIAQIETAAGVENVEKIAAVPGIDILWIGHNDLTNSMGIPGQFTHPAYLAAVERVLAACKATNKPAGIMSGSVADARAALAQGFRIVAYNGDLWIYGQALKEGLKAIQL